MLLHYQFWYWSLLSIFAYQALKEAPCFVCLFDESYESTTKKGEMDMSV